MQAKDLKIIFMGTPEFAAFALQSLIENGYNVVAAVTVPDKPAGRGRKLQQSAVKKYALDKNIELLQPEKLKDNSFIDKLATFNADLYIVVAFRMLPKIVWAMPKLGTFNLHASLLPQYRGAAPINWAVINGEKTSGVSTFFIDKEIDTGNIILQQEIEITQTDTAGSLHDKIMHVGAKLINDTIDTIAEGGYELKSQSSLISNNEELKPAPKIFKNDCLIDWTEGEEKIYNFIRGLSPYPGAWTKIKDEEKGKELSLKIFETELITKQHNHNFLDIITDKNNIFIALKNSMLSIKVLQLEGKKRLKANELLNGYSFDNKIISE